MRDPAPPGTSSRLPDGRSTPLLLAAVWIAAVGGGLGAVSVRGFDLDRFFVPKELALHTSALIVAIAALLDGRVPASVRPSATRWPIVLWLALTIASGVAAVSGWHALRAASLSLSAAMIFVAATSLGRRGHARSVAIAIATAITLAVASSLLQAYGLNLNLFAANRAPGGTLGNRNFVAHVAAMGVPLLAWLAATSRSRLGGSTAAIASLMSISALVLSRTRAAWLSLAIWAALMMAVLWHGRHALVGVIPPRRLRALSVAVAGGVLGALLLPNTLDWKSDSPYLDSVRGVVNYREGSGAGRVRQYANSLRMAAAHPLLGVGPGNWPVVYPTFADRNDPSIQDQNGMAANPWPSSDWVAAITERGGLAACAWAAFVVALLVAAWRTWRDPAREGAERAAALAGMGVVLLTALEGVFDAVTLLAFPSVVMMAVAGALIVAAEPERRPATAAEWSIAPRMVLVAVWVGFALFAWSQLQSMRLYGKGTRQSVLDAARLGAWSYRIQLRAAELEEPQGCAGVVKHARQAQKLFPYASAPKAMLSRCGG